jgi:glycosyltransferase involved in cell wall biosynthesis
MPKPSVCLNMIVKNESARIERALASVTATVKVIFLHDTGSTDDTIAKAYEFADAHNIPIHVSCGTFENFSQARNEAFRIAKTMNGAGDLPWCQFALLMDADMELVVEAPSVFHKLKATAVSYDMMQKGGTVSYMNRRLVNLQTGKDDIYVGVTHEYIDLPAYGLISGAMFVDHADGANRTEKYKRDAQLLEEDLRTNPNNGRSLFYLGNSYADWGLADSTVLPYAIDAYTKRITLGGWDEETHQAMISRASCELRRDNPARFVQGMVEAYNFRPSRAEPLYELAKYYRERGDHAASLLFSKAGVNIPRPNDVLFVNDFVYSHGLRYEYAVEGYYDEAERNRAFQVTDDLALDPTCPADLRWSARSNLYWFTKPLSHYCGSFKDRQINFLPPRGYTAMNPSIEVCNGKIKCNVRAVNYKIDEHGRYMIGDKGCQEAPIDTRNFVLTLDDSLDTQKVSEVIWHRPEATFPLVTGLEDIRLWRFHGEMYFTATVREQNYHGHCQMVQGKLVHDIDDKYMMVDDWKVISDGDKPEKNWMPMPANGGAPRFMYRCDTVTIPEGLKRVATVHPVKIDVNNISGSSQLIEFKSGLLGIVHEAATGPDGKRTYWHRFAWFEKDGMLRRLSLPFVFLDRQIEFCAGLAYHPNRNDLIISFGVRDAEAHLATVSIEEVAMMCWKFHEN